MRKKVLVTTLSCGLFAVLAAATAYSQLPGTSVRATIPFAFSVRGKTLPAGDYEIKRLNDEPEGLIISSLSDTQERAIFQTTPVEAKTAPRTAEIVFRKYGDSYFLSEVFTGGEQDGRELLPSHQERVLMRESASNKKVQPETVALVAY